MSKSKPMNCRNLKLCEIRFGIGKQFKMGVKIPSIHHERRDSGDYPYPGK